MLVGIEVSAGVMRTRAGVGNYVANLVAGLQRLSTEESQTDYLYFSNRYDLHPEAGAGELKQGDIYPHDRLSRRMAWMQLGLPRSLKRSQPDVCHFPNYLAPVLQELEVPFLSTMHDMSIYTYPQFHPLKTVAVHRAIVPQVARQSRLIVTVSESARRDILSYLKVPEEKVRVIPEGVGQQFLARGEIEKDDRIRHRYNLNFPYILTVGTEEPRKNHARLIEAFTWLVEQERLPHHLVLVGASGWKQQAMLNQLNASKLAERIHFTGYVLDTDLPALYRGADAFAFPSLHEGFGLPVLEALSSGTPTLISNDPALQEVTGEGGAISVNPYQAEEIAAGLFQILTNRAIAESLRLKGTQRARQFSWDKCAAETYQLYREVYESQPISRPHYTSAADSSVPAEENAIDNIMSWPKLPALLPSELELSIVKTVLYSDVFAFPLTLPEIQHYLIGYSTSIAEVERCFAHSLYLNRYLIQQGKYICLRGHEDNIRKRVTQAVELSKHWKAAKRWAKVLQAVPFLQTAIITGGLAVENAQRGDDIDLLLITEPGRLWTCRALVIGLVRLARLQGVELCPNYLLAANDLPLTLSQRDLYAAHELAQMRLLFGAANYNRLLSLNGWMSEMLPNALAYSQARPPLLESETAGLLGRVIRRSGEFLLGGKIGQRFEKWEQRRKIARYASQPGDETRFSAEVCKGHFGGYAHTTLEAYAQRCREFFGDNQPAEKEIPA